MKRSIAAGIAAFALLAVIMFWMQEARQKFARQALFSELKPVALSNCIMRRFGNPHDGGYVMCANLLHGVQSAYSYGIGGRDEWGCDISKEYRVPVHQYDCFSPARPVCPEGNFIFHEECIGDKFRKEEGRLFDSLTNQIAKDGDLDKTLVIKMDVEGSEWDALLATPDPVFNRIAQLAIEFHVNVRNPDGSKYIRTIRKLKQTFYIANVHFNNSSCTDDYAPLPAWAFEVLFVSKRIGRIHSVPSSQILANAWDAPNLPGMKDCQARW